MKMTFAAFVIIFSFTLLKAQEDAVLAENNKFVGAYDEAVKHFLEGNIQKAEEYFRIVLKNKPDDINTLKYLAEISIAKQNLEMIEYYYGRVLTLNPDDVEALISLGVIHLNNGRIKKAEELLLKAVNNQPNNELALFNLSVLYGTIGEFSSAVKILKKLIAINPSNGKYYQTLGMYYLFENLFSDAEDNFLEALKNDQDLIEARKGLVILYQNQKKFSESIRYIKELESFTPELQHLNILKAFQQYLQGEIESAIKYALKENEQYPEEPDAYYLLSDLYKIYGNDIKSSNFFEKAERLNRNYSYQSIYSLLNVKY